LYFDRFSACPNTARVKGEGEREKGRIYLPLFPLLNVPHSHEPMSKRGRKGEGGGEKKKKGGRKAEDLSILAMRHLSPSGRGGGEKKKKKGKKSRFE